MKYPQKIMKKSKLEELGLDPTWLDKIYRTRTDRKVAWKGGSGKKNSPIYFDTEELEKLRRAQCTG